MTNEPSPKKFSIPPDFKKNLPMIYEQTFRWTVDIHLRPDYPTRGSITHYAVNDNAYGNIILVPGIASNTRTEPLMQSISYWALTHRYNVYALDSFLGKFTENPTLDDAQRNTYPEFINLIDVGIDMIEKYCTGTWTCLIGHSMGATAAVQILNKRILDKKKPRVSAAILFAPLLQPTYLTQQKSIFQRFCNMQDMSEESKTPIKIIGLYDFSKDNKRMCISIMPKFLYDAFDVKSEPDLMNAWGIPVTIVAGGVDRKVPVTHLRAVYDQVSKMSNGKLFKFVVSANSKHSFYNLAKYPNDIFNLIKSQRLAKPGRTR